MPRAVIVAVLLLTACAAPDRSTGSDGSLVPDSRVALPEYDLETFRRMIEELRGTPVVVNFWGSWCPPCRVEAPELAEAARRYAGRVQFIGVDILDNRGAARDFILASDWQYPSVFDPEGEIRDGLGYVGQPITVIYDRDGALAFEWNGIITLDLLARELRKVL
ncbi:MAG TPA: TlpA disulfide reductase family protein [Actinomycetota bacterium]|nr:TlpA disulfide reductase family protein [Actinomycetota bacterium]